MVVYYPFLGALSLASGTILERYILKKKQTSVRIHHCLEFLAISLMLSPFLYFFWKVSPEALEITNLAILGIAILFALIANFFLFSSVKGEKISNLEPARASEPLFLVLFVLLFSLFFDLKVYESTHTVIYPALIAGFAIIFSHIEKHHLRFKKYFILAILGSVFFALELVVSRAILDYYSPISFYFIRCLSLFILGVILFNPKLKEFKKLDKKIYFDMLGLGIIFSLYRIIMYYGYIHLGIISTTLVFMLSPILIYSFAWIILKEKPKIKNILASIVIICCVIYGTLIAI